MKCYYHPTVDSTAACSVCRKFLCATCSHTIKGKVYCQDCLVAGAELAGVATSPRVATYSPGRAALFAVVPGIGAVYNREYVKALVHFAVFAALWMVADRGPGIFVLAVLSFWIYTIIDAYRSAQAILRLQVTQPEAVEREPERINAPVWGVALVLLGILFFLNNLGLEFRFIERFWPLIFVALGIYLILDYYVSPKKPSFPSAPPARQPEEKQ